MHYGNTWRIHRRLFHRFFNVSVADQFDDKIHKAINVFLRRLSESPGRFLNHVQLYVSLHPIQSLKYPGLTTRLLGLRSMAGSLTLSVAYGVNVESENDDFYVASEDAMHAVDFALIPGTFLVDSLPIRMCCTQGSFSRDSYNTYFSQ